MHLPANTFLILDHIPKGCGHIRVASALKRFYPLQQGAQTHTLDAYDSSMQSLRGTFSSGTLGIALFERCEWGIQEKLLSRLLRYIAYLRCRAIASFIQEGVMHQITKLGRIVVIAAHFEPAQEVETVRHLL